MVDFTKRLAANSLMVTITIALIIGILTSSLIVLAYYNRTIQSIGDIDEKLRRNIASAMVLALADSNKLDRKVSDTIDLFIQGNDSVIIDKKPWGVFGVSVVHAINYNRTLRKAFMFGSVLPSYMEAGLYLNEHERPLALVGNTQLVGDAYLPKSGLQTAYIGGKAFSGSKMIDGKINTSRKSLPPLESKTVKYLSQLCEFSSWVSGNSFISGDSVVQSFQDSILVIYKEGVFSLENCQYRGQVIIVSDSVVEIHETARLENVLVLAPVVKLENNFAGMLQVIATDSIIVGEGCNLKYPSSIVLMKKQKSTLQNQVRIADNSVIEGLVVTITEEKDSYKTLVEVGNSSVIKGTLYTNGYLYLKGKVYGTVVTDYFLYKSPGGIFENHLVDAEINRHKLSPHFIFPLILSGSKKNGIIQWLD